MYSTSKFPYQYLVSTSLRSSIRPCLRLHKTSRRKIRLIVKTFDILTPSTHFVLKIERVQIHYLGLGQTNFPSVMGGVCKIWLFIHRSMLFYDY